MALTGKRTYVGFGFGAIQAGLFLHEAFCADAFGRFVVAEVLPEVVAAVRQAKGYFSVNIAHSDRVAQAKVGPIEIENPGQSADRRRLIEAIAEAEEIGTAIPSVKYYVSKGSGSLHRILAEGLRRKAARGGPRAVIYTAENHNQAAEILETHVLAEIPEDERPAVQAQVRFLNTVIAKMSGIITDPEEIQKQNLIPITPGEERAFLVETFNRILVSKIKFDEPEEMGPFQRGIWVFEEKENLLPFEEAKFYGHNATHALAAYIGMIKGMEHIADLQAVPGVLPFLRNALIKESGEALVQKHAGADSLFTPEGYRQYADDLLGRMFNPHLRDTVERVGRDPERKLGWDDRLIGAIRLALRQGLEPRRYALGTAAALATIPGGGLAPDHSTLALDVSATELLSPLWSQASPAKFEQAVVFDLIEEGRRRLKRWLESGGQTLEEFFRDD